jgi:hypothetical protein
MDPTIRAGVDATADLSSVGGSAERRIRPSNGPGARRATDRLTEATSSKSDELAADAVMRQFGPAVLTKAVTRPSNAADPAVTPRLAPSEATDFVPVRVDIDIDVLRAALTDMAMLWLGDDAAPVAEAIAAARPGVDDFVSTIAAIGRMEIRGHESPVIRAMSREMHYHAAEILCGV